MSNQKQKGFSLLELMIVVAIVGILVGVAYPAYTEFVNQARRSDGMAALLDAQLEQEKFRANNTSYATAAQIVSAGVPTTSPDGYYTVTVASVAANTFTMTATPSGAQAGDSCGTFAVNQSGPDYSGSYADSDCWQR